MLTNLFKDLVRKGLLQERPDVCVLSLGNDCSVLIARSEDGMDEKAQKALAMQTAEVFKRAYHHGLSFYIGRPVLPTELADAVKALDSERKDNVMRREGIFFSSSQEAQHTLKSGSDWEPWIPMITSGNFSGFTANVEGYFHGSPTAENSTR